MPRIFGVADRHLRGSRTRWSLVLPPGASSSSSGSQSEFFPTPPERERMLRSAIRAQSNVRQKVLNGQLGIAHHVLDALVPEIRLEGTGVVAIF
jgi:hypothetical protein